MQSELFNWGEWPAGLTSERLALLLPCSAALFLLSVFSLGELSLLRLGFAVGLLIVYACGALLLLGTQLVSAPRVPLLLTLLMLGFAVLIAATVLPKAMVLLLLLPVLHAVMRLSDRGINLILVLAAVAWVGLRNLPLPPAPLNLLLSLVELLPAAVLFLVAYAQNRALTRGRRHVVAAASRDPLTNLLNMTAFDRLLTVQHANAVANSATYALLVVDIDGLRRFNELHGHAGGNRVLVAVADAIRRSTRVGDLVARFAGDEFVVCLPDADDAAATALANRVSQNVYNITVSFERSTARVGVHTGSAVYPDSGQDIESMLKFATSALERDKAFKRSSAAPRPPAASVRQQAGVDDWT